MLLIEEFILQNEGLCSFFQWIDGLEMWNPQILLFLYDRNESFTYRSVQRWVPLPPNPPPMTDEETEEATTHRVRIPPLCKCGYWSMLANLPTRLDYTPFWHCPITSSVIAHKRCLSLVVMKVMILYTWHCLQCVLQGNKWGCDFNELVYGPRSHWSEDLEIDIVIFGVRWFTMSPRSASTLSV
jgi:hypothetical protein